ncbi:tetratricopeptide repeat protein [Pseudoroseomonas wenyumeiae]
MLALIPSRRAALLALALLSGTAAGGLPWPGASAAPAPASAPAAGEAGLRPTASGAYLAGRFASSESDTPAAANWLLEALRLAPDEPEVINRAFLATVLDGRPEAVRVARRMPDSEVAALLLAGADAMAGRWERAETRLRGMARQGAGQVLQPLLLAWAQAGRGNTDAALATLKPTVEGSRLSGIAALHAAMIADLGNKPKEADRLIRVALANTPEVNLRLVQIAAGILGRAGKEAEAMKLVESISTGTDDLAMLGTLPSAAASCRSAPWPPPWKAWRKPSWPWPPRCAGRAGRNWRCCWRACRCACGRISPPPCWWPPSPWPARNMPQPPWPCWGKWRRTTRCCPW